MLYWKLCREYFFAHYTSRVKNSPVFILVIKKEHSLTHDSKCYETDLKIITDDVKKSLQNVNIHGSGCKQWIMITHRHFDYKSRHTKSRSEYGIVKIWESFFQIRKNPLEIYRRIHLHRRINKYCLLIYVDSFIY